MSADKYDTIDLRRVCIDVLARWMVHTGPWSSYASRTTILKLVCDNLLETSGLQTFIECLFFMKYTTSSAIRKHY